MARRPPTGNTVPDPRVGSPRFGGLDRRDASLVLSLPTEAAGADRQSARAEGDRRA